MKIKQQFTITEKFCRGCSRTKPISEFHIDRNNTTGYRHRCKECTRKQVRIYCKKPEVVERHRVLRARGKPRQKIFIPVERMDEIIDEIYHNNIETALSILESYAYGEENEST